MIIEYKGYSIVIDLSNLSYKISELLSSGKYKVRRRVTGWDEAGKFAYGSWVYPFRDLQHLTEHYTNYIDNHIVSWANSPHNRSKQ